MTAIRVSTKRHSFHIVHDAKPEFPVGTVVTSPHEAVTIAQHLIGSDMTECLIAIFLDARHRVTGYAEIARGTLNATRFSARDVLIPALRVACGSLVVAHNHPSGIAEPSRADRDTTLALRDACKLIGIHLVDHVVVTATTYWSFREAEGWEQ